MALLDIFHDKMSWLGLFTPHMTHTAPYESYGPKTFKPTVVIVSNFIAFSLYLGISRTDALWGLWCWILRKILSGFFLNEKDISYEC